MALQEHSKGRELKFFAREEGVFGLFTKPTGSDAMKVLSTGMEFGQERAPRNDSRQTRSLLERITRGKTVSWSVEKYLIPSGSPGVPPDDNVLISGAMGIRTIDPGVSVIYTLLGTQFVQHLTLVRHTPPTFMEAVVGAYVESMTLSFSGGDEPRISFEGVAKDHIHTGTAELDGAMAATATMLVDAVDGFNIYKDSVVQIGSDDNSGAGHKVIVDTARPSFTMQFPATASDGDPVVPFTPTEVTAGSPIAGILGSIDIDFPAGSTELPITAFEITLTNNNKAVVDQAFQDSLTQIITGFRAVAGSISLRLGKAEAIQLGGRKTFTTRLLTVESGDTAGQKVLITLPSIEIDFSSVDIPEAEEATFTLPFTALGTTGEDEMELKFF